MHRASSNVYLPAVDGLRTVAVLSVVVFHFFPDFLKGGFVGVDIFFVISGYLVTGIILNNIQRESFSVVEFYRKRVVRLFPALSLVIIVFFLVACLSLLALEFKRFGLHVFSSVFFFSNVLYFTESGYFDAASEVKPFLHLWSLSLEEQFYLIWPFTLCALQKINKRELGPLTYQLAGICFISFVSCLVATYINKDFAFFNLPFRIWELGLGSITFPISCVPPAAII